MLRVITTILLCMLCMNIPFVSAKGKKDKNVAPVVQKTTPISQDEFNFTDSANYVTDEQLEKANSKENLEEKDSWIERIIDSSHFSSDTATKTYMPINKVQD